MKHTLVLVLLGFCFSAFGGTLENKSYFRYLDSNNLSSNDISLQDAMGETPLHRAAATGDAVALKELMQDGAKYLGDIDGKTPLMYAIVEKHIDLALGLVEAGASIYENDIFQNTTRKLAEKHLSKDNADYLIGMYNLRTDYLNKFPTAEEMIFAMAKRGDYYALKTIIEKGDARIRGMIDPETGNTLTHIAATGTNTIDVINYLSKNNRKSNLAVRNDKKQTPLFIAMKLGYKHLYPHLLGLDSVALFIHGESDGELLTPYELVKETQDQAKILEFEQILNFILKSEEIHLTFRIVAHLELSGQPKHKMLEGLNNAVSYEDLRLLQYFIDAGISFTEGYKGMLPLNEAIKSKTYINVNFMMKMGISQDIKDRNGVSARELAEEMNDSMLTDILAGKHL
ncbi:MAG: ankyrin repeat protein [Oleiphilaceae bacterium]|jgi:ankyrin repeat protein